MTGIENKPNSALELVMVLPFVVYDLVLISRNSIIPRRILNSYQAVPGFPTRCPDKKYPTSHCAGHKRSQTRKMVVESTCFEALART